MLLVASLLSFYEQLIIFENHNKKLREYNIERPLWIFVGSKVTGSGLNSDIIKILHFLNKLLGDESYLKEKVKKILEGKSELIDKEGNDIFKGKFEYVKKFDIDIIIDGIYQKVFNGKGKLKLYEIKIAEGEIGLKTSTGEKYFGVINVGNVRELKNLIVDSDIEVEEDHMSQSLFFDINKNNSPLNILIGSKKFIEGWNSWRVSVMGLINMGQSEGPQIIQLFGRGVRLKGKNYSLKREENPDYKLKVSQTLFIFGLNADYINAFLKAIGNEGTDYEEISIPIKFNYPGKWEGKLYTIKTRNFDFLEYPVKFTLDEDILGKVKIDLRPKITLAHGLETGSTDTILDEPVYIPDEYLELIDWEKILLEIVNFKTVNGMFNLVLDREFLKQIIRSRNYEIYLPETEGIKVESNEEAKPTLKLTSFQGLEKLHEIILMILKSYITKFYEREERKKSMDFLEPEPLTIDNHLHMYPEEKEIIVKIPTKLADEIKGLQEQIREYFLGNLPESWKNWHSFVIHFDNHLYTPLIIWQKNQEEIKSIPVKLNEGETNFVKDLKDFIERNKNKLEGLEIFLLRNLSKKGVGFFIKSGFYPDFIIWIKNGNKQNIIFVDPKGIRNLGGFDNEKIQFCVRYIKEIEEKVREKIKHKDDQIFLDAFIVAVYPYKTTKDMYYGASREKFEEHNVLFQKDDRKYVEKIFRKVGVIGEIERESLKFKL
jgi:cation transport regulator ChaB